MVLGCWSTMSLKMMVGIFKCAIYKQYSINKSSIFGLVSFVHPPWILLYFKWNTHSKEFLCKEMNVSYFFLKSCESWDKTVSVLAIPRAILILQHFGKIFAFARFIISLNSSCVWAGARKLFKFKTTLDGRRVCKLEHNSKDRWP